MQRFANFKPLQRGNRSSCKLQRANSRRLMCTFMIEELRERRSWKVQSAGFRFQSRSNAATLSGFLNCCDQRCCKFSKRRIALRWTAESSVISATGRYGANNHNYNPCYCHSSEQTTVFRLQCGLGGRAVWGRVAAAQAVQRLRQTCAYLCFAENKIAENSRQFDRRCVDIAARG